MLLPLRAWCLFFLLSTVLGCSDTLVLEFHHPADETQRAEEEIKDALKGIADVGRFTWENKGPGGDDNQRLLILFDEAEGNQNYSVEQVITRLQEKLGHQQREVSFSLEIKETNESILSTLDIKPGDSFSAAMDWENAQANIFYTETEHSVNLMSLSYTNVMRTFYCAIRVPIEGQVPNLNYKMGFEGEASAVFSQLFDAMQLEAKNQKDFVGIPAKSDTFVFKLERDSDNEKYYSTAFLIFENLGTKTQRKDKFSYLHGVERPDGANEESCKKNIREKAGSNFYGVAGGVAAQDNLVEVIKASKL